MKSSINLELIFSQLYRWHNWGKEMLLICPRQPISVRCWIRIWTRILLLQRWSLLWTVYCLNLYHTRIWFVTLGTTRQCWRWCQCVCGAGMEALLRSRQAVYSSSHLKKGAPWLIHRKCSGRWAISRSPFHALFLSFQKLPGTALPARTLQISARTYICRSKKTRMTTLKVRMVHFFTVKNSNSLLRRSRAVPFPGWLKENTRHLKTCLLCTCF